MKLIVYGDGGFDPNHPTNNVIDEVDVHDLGQEPLDAPGALATLLAVKGVLTTEEAAVVVGRNPSDLIAEAQAWAVARDLNH